MLPHKQRPRPAYTKIPRQNRPAELPIETGPGFLTLGEEGQPSGRCGLPDPSGVTRLGTSTRRSLECLDFLESDVRSAATGDLVLDRRDGPGGERDDERRPVGGECGGKGSGGRGQAAVALSTPGRFSKRAFASRETTVRPVSAAWAAMIRSWAPRGCLVRRTWASRRAW